MIRWSDAALALWVGLWIVVGWTVASELRTLTELSDTMVLVGTAARDAGTTLSSVGSLPLVGDELSGPARDLRAAGDQAVSSGRASSESIRSSSTLVGLALAIIPTVPLLAFYLPWRRRWWRDRRGLEATIVAADGDPRLELWLARRALERLPYGHVAELVDEPWAGAHADEARALADAELARYGLRR